MRREVLKLEFKTVLSFTSELQNVRLGNLYKFWSVSSSIILWFLLTWPDQDLHAQAQILCVCWHKSNSIKYFHLFVSNSNYCICISKRRKCHRYQSGSYKSWWSWWSVRYLGLRWETPTRLRSAWQPWPWWLLVVFQFTITGFVFTCSAVSQCEVTVLLVAGFSTYCCYCSSSAPRSPY